MTKKYEELKQDVLSVLQFYQVDAAIDEAVEGVFDIHEAFDESAAPSKVFMPFKELPKGARFKYPDGNDVWVAIETYGNGLIAKWNGLEDKRWQSLCCFVDDEWSLDSLVEVVG